MWLIYLFIFWHLKFTYVMWFTLMSRIITCLFTPLNFTLILEIESCLHFYRIYNIIYHTDIFLYFKNENKSQLTHMIFDRKTKFTINTIIAGPW